MPTPLLHASTSLLRLVAGALTEEAGESLAGPVRLLGELPLRGLALSALATAVLALLLWVLIRTRRAVSGLLARAASRHAEGLASKGVDLAPIIKAVARAAVLGGSWAVGVALVDAWVTFVLARFEATAPWADALNGQVLGVLKNVGLEVVRSVPGLVGVAVIVLIARGTATFLEGLFDRVAAGTLQVPGVHAETLNATRRLATALVWVVALAASYPYLPGAGTEGFKGLSLVIGVMVSLGSTGLVAQAMSGLVVVYSRSLAAGDYVRLGETEGVVSEVGMLSTKVVTLRGEEVTVPNGVVIGGPVHNFTRLTRGKGAQVSTTVTIGYDAPWRTVEALLLEAASRTQGLRGDPRAYVLQRALQDFYVQYDLVVRLEQPLDRPQVMSRLHANIQDAFNEAGVQIMSPHFLSQPEQAVLGPPPPKGPPPSPPPGPAPA